MNELLQFILGYNKMHGLGNIVTTILINTTAAVCLVQGQFTVCYFSFTLQFKKDTNKINRECQLLLTKQVPLVIRSRVYYRVHLLSVQKRIVIKIRWIVGEVPGDMR